MYDRYPNYIDEMTAFMNQELFELNVACIDNDTYESYRRGTREAFAHLSDYIEEGFHGIQLEALLVFITVADDIETERGKAIIVSTYNILRDLLLDTRYLDDVDRILCSVTSIMRPLTERIYPISGGEKSEEEAFNCLVSIGGLYRLFKDDFESTK